MVAYNKSDVIEVGTKVRVASWTAPYAGEIGEVVPALFGDRTRSQANPKRTLTYVQLPSRTRPFGFYTDNLERIEKVSTTPLVGPKPEPVKEPEHPTPWRAHGRVIIDANGVQVLKIQKSSEYSPILYDKAQMLARILAEAVSEKFAKKEDTPSPF